MTTITSPYTTRTLANARRDANGDAAKVRAAGVALAAGATTWAVGLYTMGTNPTDKNAVAWNATALAFQLGVLALVHTQFRTRATGTGRLAKAFLLGEHVLLLAAIASTGVGFGGTNHSAIANALDAFWPLSMIGMFAIGVRIAIAERWRGSARVWPLVAESWAFVSVPAAKINDTVGQYVGGTHLLIGYATLGVILAVRPQLTRR